MTVTPPDPAQGLKPTPSQPPPPAAKPASAGTVVSSGVSNAPTAQGVVISSANATANTANATAVPQVRFQSNGTSLELILPPESEQRGGSPSPGLSLTWMEIWHQLKQRLNGAQRFWAAETEVHLMAHDRLLDGRQLQAIAEALTSVQLQLKRVSTSRRQTAVVAATAGYSVEQQHPPTPTLLPSSSTPAKALADPLYIQMTLRSGAEIRHPGTVIVFGDLNPGSSIIADGDILIWGRLRGVAHAGASGNLRCLITALQMEPTQLRIAHMMARAPSNPPDHYYPEVAYVTAGGICIMGITEFSKKSLPLLAELEDTGVSS
jgi:septum site-determining protein MinC